MAFKLSDLFVKLGLDNKQYNNELESSGRKTSNFGKGVSKIGGLIAGTFAVGKIVSFGQELMELGGTAEGVRAAFERIGGTAIMDDLKKATVGTVSELELMKRAVSARNLGLPIENLASLFEFATKRAQDTGESVDYLVNSIVTGIGRKSPLILDNLGISAIQLREKLKGVGMETASVAEVAAAVGEIAAESMRESGGIIDTNAVKIQNLKAQWANFKLELAEDPVVLNAFSTALNFITRELKLLPKELETSKKALDFVFGSMIKTTEATWEYTTAAEEEEAALKRGRTARQAQIDLLNKGLISEVEHIKTIGELKAETEALTKSLDDYGINQDEEIQKTLRQIDANKKLIEELTTLKRTQNALAIDAISGVEAPSFDTKIEIPTELENLTGFLEKNNEKVKQLVAELKEDGWKQALADEEEFVDNMNQIMADGMADFISTFAEGIGRLASGDINFDEFFNSILGQIGKFLMTFGEALIAYGIASDAFKKAFSNPYVAIAAGAALVAIGGFITGLGSSGPQGFSGGGGGSVSSGSFNVVNTNVQDQRLVASVTGRQLDFVLTKYNSDLNRR